jgi:TatD DNase family protein
MDQASPPVALIDMHCHVDLFPDPVALVKEIERHRIYTIAVTNTPSVFSRLREIVGGAQFVRTALGLHPELAVERHRELALFETLLPHTRYVGEVGLDYQTSVEADRSTQRRVLTAIIDYCDAAGGKIVTVHSRRAADDVVDAFGERFRGKYILHWYSGGVRTLRRAVGNGAYISVNPAMVRSERGRTLIAEVPRDRVLTETDGPFVMIGMSAAAIPATPFDVHHAVAGLAALWAIDVEEARDAIYRNFKALIHQDSQ